MPKEIYLDNAAATAVDSRALRAQARAANSFANPSSFNDAGRSARDELDRSRAAVAAFLNCRPAEVVFCASGSEANTLALIGFGHTRKEEKPHIISVPTEHPSVLASVRRLERRGWSVSWLPVDGEGRVDAADVTRALTKRTRLVSVMYANNEAGTIQPIKKIASAITSWRRTHRTLWPLLHVDACQAAAWLPMDVQALGADLLTLNGAKAYGPHGTAALYVRRSVELRPQVMGGEQEGGRRAGTEDGAGAAGLAAALMTIRPADTVRTARLRDRTIARILAVIPDARLNGPRGRDRLANNINVSVPDAVSETLLLELDKHGIRAGAGSACTAHRVEPSHVLVAMRVPKLFLTGALRFSLSRRTTAREIAVLVRALPRVVEEVRRRSLHAGKQA